MWPCRQWVTKQRTNHTLRWREAMVKLSCEHDLKGTHTMRMMARPFHCMTTPTQGKMAFRNGWKAIHRDDIEDEDFRLSCLDAYWPNDAADQWSNDSTARQMFDWTIRGPITRDLAAWRVA